MRRLLALPAIALVAANTPAAGIEIRIENVRNPRGVIHACVTRERGSFPDCSLDPGAHRVSVPARTRNLRFANVEPGRYAITLFHDENSNQRLDTFAAIPREGFGFSRNPAMRFGAPKFRQVEIPLHAGLARITIRMQYLL